MDQPTDDLITETTFIEDAVAVIRVAGEIDIASCDILTAAAWNATELGAQRIILEMAEVTFIDSSGIAALIAARSVAVIELRQPSAAVARLLTLTGLDGTFVVDDTLQVEP